MQVTDICFYFIVLLIFLYFCSFFIHLYFKQRIKLYFKIEIEDQKLIIHSSYKLYNMEYPQDNLIVYNLYKVKYYATNYSKHLIYLYDDLGNNVETIDFFNQRLIILKNAIIKALLQYIKDKYNDKVSS